MGHIEQRNRATICRDAAILFVNIIQSVGENITTKLLGLVAVGNHVRMVVE